MELAHLPEPVLEEEKDLTKPSEEEKKAQQGTLYAIATQPKEKESPITDEMIEERLMGLAEHLKEWLQHLPPEVRRTALYSILTYLEEAKEREKYVKEALERERIYGTPVAEISTTSDTSIGEIQVRRVPGGKEFYYKGREIEDGIVVAKYGSTTVTFPEENLAQQYRELKEDGYEEVFYVHKEGNKVVIERLSEEGGENFLGTLGKSYMVAQDSEGNPHVITFQYVPEKEGIVTYYKVDNGEWKKLERENLQDELGGFKDELGRPLPSLFSEDEGFLYPTEAFKATYLEKRGEEIQLEGAQTEQEPVFLLPVQEVEMPTSSIDNTAFLLRLREAVEKAAKDRKPVEGMSEEEAREALLRAGYSSEQVNTVLGISPDGEFLEKLVEVLTEEKEEVVVPVLTGKETFQAYLNYLEGKPLEQEINVEELPEAMREEIRKGVEAMEGYGLVLERERV